MATDPKTGQQIMGRYSVGLQNVGSYQVSGIPWLTGSTIASSREHTINFPKVVKSVTVIASSSGTPTGELQVAFNSSSAGDVFTGRHYVSLDTDKEAATFDVKCKHIYIRCTGDNHGYQIIAELTNIPASSMPDTYITGSGATSINDGGWSESSF
jgi:hypothetical protein